MADPEAELAALQQQQTALKAELDAERKRLLEIQRKKKRLYPSFPTNELRS